MSADVVHDIMAHEVTPFACEGALGTGWFQE